MEIHQITHLPRQIPALEKEAVAEGFGYITRLNRNGIQIAIASMRQANA